MKRSKLNLIHKVPYLINLRMKNIIFLILFYIFLTFFLVGFFPMQYTGLDSEIGKSYTFNKSHVQKTVFIIIDALRYDFVSFPNGKKNFPFVTSLLEEEKGCLLRTRVEAPTVTMPRIKALTTGTVPNFIDVVLNIGSPELKDSNIVRSAKEKGLKLFFYGDDTWLKLFPNLFHQSEGTTSFFASDFTEVDNNVTRHLDVVFKQDWDVLILHYLGLDHIGHLEGPFSSLVQPKLNEMDHVIEKVYGYLQNLENQESKQSLLLVSGDHGMKDSGGHGGVSHAEVTVPLLSLKQSCRKRNRLSYEEAPAQIDVASTLSFLLDLPIPTRNMGKIIPQLLNSIDDEELLIALHYNKQQLLGNLKPSHKELQNYEKTSRMYDIWVQNTNKTKEMTEELINIYLTELKSISDELVSSNTQFNLPLLIFSVTALSVLFLIFLCKSVKLIPRPETYSEKFLVAGSILQVISLASSSFIEEEHQVWYFLWITYCTLLYLQDVSDWKIIVVIVLHRILKKLNQTGDKWAHLTDISDVLYTDTDRLWLFLLFVLGLLMVVAVIYKTECSVANRLLVSSLLTSVLLYHVAVNSFPLSFLKFYPRSRGSTEVSMFWCLLIILTIRLMLCGSNVHISWILLGVLLCRPHNVVLIPILCLVSKVIHKVHTRPKEYVWNSLSHYWLAHVFYFYEGNSNSLANVDVAAGYIGLESYKPVYVGLLIFSHTYFSHVLCYMLSHKSDHVICIVATMPVLFYTVLLIIQRHHLFIWSVFSPKLLYQFSFLTVIIILIVFNFAIKLKRSKI